MGAGTRVIVLTDGVPTRGTIDSTEIIGHTRMALGESILTTFGYGRDVDPVLLHELATIGRGNFAFINGGEPPLRRWGPSTARS
jgi:hypothetical protein